MAALASSSSQVRKEKYDVFISFRGSDTRRGFLSHLQRALCQSHIDVYVDESLERGEEISSALMKAIEGSMISLVVFSKDYASSRWCLKELVKIMECKQTNQQIVMPVFYDIDPSDVRHQTGPYADAFAKHEEEFKDNTDKLLIWRSVLNQIANLSGHHSSNFKNESELIVEITNNIMKKLEDKYPRKCGGSKLLVGIYQNFSKVRSLMNIEPKEVRFLGIWGTGGIGKTTLAQEIFDHFSSQFERSCFLENVTAKSKKIEGFKHLRPELLSKLLNQRSLHVNAAIGRLQQKKVLIVLDDVDKPKQVKDLAIVEKTFLGCGSRVIITSRDKHVLMSAGIDEEYIHEVKELNFEESLKLFNLNAFKQSYPKTGYEELSKRTVSYAKGIPLALEVLGCHFFSRSNIYWESELRKLKRCPNQDIQNTLRVSYDGLDSDDDKQIFLDIAFFFIGEQKDKVTSILEACNFEATSGIENLVNKALIKISDEGVIELHNLVHEMGEQIVREESPKHPEKRSRLKSSEEIFYVLKDNMGTNKIEGITVDVAQIKEVQLRANTFTKMKNLRIIKFYSSYGWHMESHITIPRDLKSIPNKLRCFHWDGYPLKSLPLGFCPENLVELQMENSNMIKLWDGVQDLPNLKMINLIGSQKLVELPDFSMTRKLETVYLDSCKNLGSVHPSILSRTLVNLDVSNCSKLVSLESEAHLKSLSYFIANGCSSLRKFCLSLEKIEQLDLLTSKITTLHLPISGELTELRGLYLNGSRLKSLPINELCCLTKLESFRLDDFRQVIYKTQLEVLFSAWPCLTSLCLDNCSKLSEIPENISALTELKYLSLRGSVVEVLPAFFCHVSNLQSIFLNNCRKLRSILGLPPSLEKLEATDCTSLEIIFCSSRFQQQLLDHRCWLNLKNCGKFDETSLELIEKLTQCSIISASKEVDYYSACYSGSRVPNWMTYRQMGVASNTVEFTCDDKQSLIGMAFCCVLPHTPMEMTICCNYSDDNNLKFMSEYLMCYYARGGYNSDHVFMWYHKFTKGDARASYHGRIVCEFSAALHGSDNVVIMGSDVSIKECGVCPLFSSVRKRKKDAHVNDLASLLKRKYRPELQFL